MSLKFYLKKLYKEYLFRFRYARIQSDKKSVYFFTFHKCASSLFSKHILKGFNNLQHVDYANYLADKKETYNKELDFLENGCIYGPIRISANDNIVYNLLVNPAESPSFSKNINAIFLIRDPRDILVSSYHSFGFTHPINEVKDKSEKQLEKRRHIQSLTLDEYVLKNIQKQKEDFERLSSIADNCENMVILKYEDMVDNFGHFISDFRKILDINDEMKNILYRETRPKSKVDSSSHKRSGKSRRFMVELKKETIDEMNARLATTLQKFNYTI